VLAAPGLRELVLTHYAARDLRAFGGLESLERLELRRGAVERLDGIDALGRLRELRLRELRRLESIDGVERLRLEALELWKCPRVRSRAPAAGIPTVAG
jgi:hypothetical protein